MSSPIRSRPPDDALQGSSPIQQTDNIGGLRPTDNNPPRGSSARNTNYSSNFNLIDGYLDNERQFDTSEDSQAERATGVNLSATHDPSRRLRSRSPSPSGVRIQRYVEDRNPYHRPGTMHSTTSVYQNHDSIPPGGIPWATGSTVASSTTNLLHNDIQNSRVNLASSTNTLSGVYPPKEKVSPPSSLDRETPDWDEEEYLEEHDRARLTDNMRGGNRQSRFQPRRSHLSATPISDRLKSIRRVSQAVLQASSRVVNFGNLPVQDKQHVVEDKLDTQQDHIQVVDSVDSPLRGKSLGIFGPRNSIRVALRNFLIHRFVEPIILILIIVNVVLLTIQAAPSVFDDPRPTTFGQSWIDYALGGVFIVFTIEMIARIIVCGFIFNPPRADTSMKPLQLDNNRPGDLNASNSLRRKQAATPDSMVDMVVYDRAVDMGYSDASPTKPKGHVKSASVSSQNTLPEVRFKNIPFQNHVRAQRSQLADVAYLRHTFNRLDFIAIISFWITAALSFLGLETADSIYIFRALSCLRALRLLSITSGTTTILQSLKKSAPLLLNVGFFVGFFFVLFAIIGVQSFKGSFQRYCVWIDPAGQSNYTLNQPCGGYLDANGVKQSFISSKTGQATSEDPKGYICPIGLMCLETGANFNGTQSFNDVFSSAMLVIVVASANTWTDLMYHAMASDFFAACIFFIAILIVLNFWLVNLFIAVINQMFAKIRDETKRSAFTSSRLMPVLNDSGEGWMLLDARNRRKPGLLLKIYEKTKLLWVLLVVADLVIMASKTNTDGPAKINFLIMAELIFTLVFLFEIIVRFIAWLPEWRGFFVEKANVVDLNLAIITCIIQIPLIRETHVYQWLTVFQIMRIYRVIIAWPRIRNIMTKILGSVWGLANVVIFIFLVTFLAALIAVQLVRGEIPAVDDNGNNIEFNFYTIYNAFVGMYQILSSENWTIILYNATSYATTLHQVIIVAIFYLSWFCLANFIFLNMFISVLQENFSIAEETKKREQLAAFIQKTQPKDAEKKAISRWNPYRYFRPNPKALEVSNLPPELVLPMKKNMVREFLRDAVVDDVQSHQASVKRQPSRRDNLVSKVKKVLGVSPVTEHFPMMPLHGKPIPNEDGAQLREQQIEAIAANEQTQEDDPMDELQEKRQRRADFLTEHPNYDRTLLFFSNGNPVRKWCQRCFPSARGERVFGTPPSPTLSFFVNLFFMACIIASVVNAAISTPAYQKTYYKQHGFVVFSWFAILDITIAGLFLLEFLMKIIADGFLFAPNAYLLNAWNDLDFFVLITLIVNVAANVSNEGDISRAVRAFKALRAIRLINVSDSIKQTFYSILVKGAPRILDAAIVSISLIVPFAIWGQNLFSGQLFFCSDNSSNLAQCTSEFNSSPLNWNVWAPRVWGNPYVWSFDNFQSALLILFEIVSMEGWIDVMWSAMSITGLDQAPQPEATPINAIYFVVYNLSGAVFVLTLFISVIIENFTIRSGQALLTTEQKQWIDLRKWLQQIRPSKRPIDVPMGGLRRWCFDRAVNKRGLWSRAMTVILLFHIGVLMTEFEQSPATLDLVRDFVFLGLIVVFLVDILVRFSGLGWQSFRLAGWNIYDLLVVSGAAITTIPIIAGSTAQVVVQLQKLFLVGIAFKLIQKSDSLNQLFKTAAASLPPIFNLFTVWFVLFVVYAITFTEIFGLTRYGSQGTDNINFRSFLSALVLLVRMSTGEGWNTIMHDHTVEAPNCVESSNYLNTDCGSTPWAYTLFISWNVLSMYIFTSMFIVVVIDNFSYVYQIAGKSSLVSRDEMRKFKRVWAQVDTKQGGYIQRKDFSKFFSKLQGVFEVKIYQDQFRIRALMADAQMDIHNLDTDLGTKPPFVSDGLDMRKLDKLLCKIDWKEVNRRKRLYNKLYQEALYSEEPGKGISFTNMLLMLAHYRLIEDDSALQLEELLQRKIRMERVTDLVNLDRVQGLLRTIYLRRKFQAYMENKHHSALNAEGNVPMIMVDNSSLQIPMTPAVPRINTNVPYARGSTSNPSPNSASPPGSPGYAGGISPYSPGSADERRSYFAIAPNRASASPSSRSSGVDGRLSAAMPAQGQWGDIDPEAEMDEETADRVLEEMSNSRWGVALRKAEADQTKF